MSRPVTIEELRRVLFALRDSAADAAATGARHDRSLFACDIAAALAALPSEQEPPAQLGKPAGSASYAAPSSAVPELPQLEDGNFRTATTVGAYTLVATAAEYDALRTAAEALRERLREALRERDAYKRAKQENDDRFMLERDAAIARAEQAEQRAAAARREALLEVAAECKKSERRVLSWDEPKRAQDYADVAAWCRQRAEEVQQ